MHCRSSVPSLRVRIRQLRPDVKTIRGSVYVVFQHPRSPVARDLILIARHRHLLEKAKNLLPIPLDYYGEAHTLQRVL